MANIRKLYDEFKDVLKESDASINELIENIKSNKPYTLVFLSGYQLLDKTCKLDLFLMKVSREGLEFATKIEEKCCFGTDTLEEIKRVHDYQALLEHVQEEQSKFYARCAKKINSVQDVAITLNLKFESCLKHKLGQK